MSDSTITQFTLRLKKTLHDQLLKAASKRDKQTLTDEIIERLENSFQPADTTLRLVDYLDLPRVMRVVSVGNTTADVDRLLQLATLVSADRWIFAARADDLNGAVMVLYVESRGSQLGVVHDHSYINMARRPRMLDVQQLMKGLAALGVLRFAEYCPTLLTDTRDASPAEAAAAIIAANPKEMNLAAYLKLLAQHSAFEVDDFIDKPTPPPKPAKKKP